jgi:ankyrin repeat protein
MPADPALVAQFLASACPDHHVRDGSSHWAVRQTAESLLRHHPEIARESIYTAIVCGDLDEVDRLLAIDPDAASRPGGPKGSAPAQGTHFVLGATVADPPLWEPLHYLCFTRLERAAANDHAVAIARRLLDHGANPNAHFMAGGSGYTPLVGVVGAGEEGRRPHPRHVELARLLLERGADPFDGQVVYNLHFTRDVIWYLQLAYDASVALRRKAGWDDPEWRMMDMGGYGSGARWFLGAAVERNSLELAAWMLAHGASPNPAPPTSPKMPSHTIWEIAMAHGYADFANLLVRYGAMPGTRPADDESAFVGACLQMDDAKVRAMLAAHPEYLRSPRALHAAATLDRPEVARMLLDLGTPIEVENAHRQRPLHVAAWQGSLRVAAFLIERGAAVDPREAQWSNTPLDFAVHGQLEPMIALLAPHSRDLWNLVFTGQVDRVRTVLEAGPSLAKTVAPDGATPLSWLPVEEARAVEIIRLFRAHGADVTIRYEGKTPEEWARARWMLDAAAALKEG